MCKTVARVVTKHPRYVNSLKLHRLKIILTDKLDAIILGRGPLRPPVGYGPNFSLAHTQRTKQ